MKLSDFLDGVLIDSGYENMLRSSGDEDRLNNVAELKQSISDFKTMMILL